jgi:hypothetical protein
MNKETHMQQWEYFTTFIVADVNLSKRDFIAMFPDIDNIARYDPRAMIPELDSLGKAGWELIHMQPVVVGNNLDVAAGGTESTTTRTWTSTYLCVFKRPLAADEE